MELTRDRVRSEAAAYREAHPLYTVEREQLETLPRAFETGAFGRRDAAWVVRWYYRRFLGDYPDDERRAIEDRFWNNEFEAVRSAVADAVAAADAGGTADAVESLTDLEAVDVPVAAAFLMFIAPDDYVVVGPREWAVLSDADELSEPYPDPPSPDDYRTYLERCRSLARAFDCELWTVYRALWRLSAPERAF